MNISKLREEQSEMSVRDIAKIIFEYFKQDRRQSAYDETEHSESLSNLYRHFFLDQFPDVTHCKPDQHTKMKFHEAFYLLQRQGLIMPMEDRRYVLTGLGYESDFDENGDILILDDAEKRVQSIYNEIPNFDSIVADFYRESIRAFQEGLLLSSCLSLGSASERTIYQLALAVGSYAPGHKPTINGKWKRSNMKDKIDILWNWVYEIGKNNFPNEPCLKDLRSKLDMLAHWYRITRNEAGHPDREAVLPTQKEIELSIHQFRRYVINIFKIINLVQSKS